MGRRTRQIFEAAQGFTLPVAEDFRSPHGVSRWVKRFVYGEYATTAAMLVWPERHRLAECCDKEEFMAVVESIEEGDQSDDNTTDMRGAVAVDEVAGQDAARAAFFEYPLEDEDVLEELWSKIKRDYWTWALGNAYMAPLFAIVQSSGWGKSRLAFELHRKGLYIIYISCMKASHSGFPGQTPHLAAWITQGKQLTVLRMAALLLASIEALADYVKGGGDPHCWILDQTDPTRGFPVANDIASRLQACTLRLEASAAAKAAALPRTFERRTTEYLSRESHTYNAVGEALKTALRDLPLDGIAFDGIAQRPDQRLKVLFCFDEASELAELELEGGMDTAFTLLRRVLGKAEFGLWALVLGTNSRLLDFVPSKAMDPTRKVRARDYKLFKPFWLTATAAVPGDLSSGSPESVFRLGRPLWRAFMDKGYTFKGLRLLAVDKLNCSGGVTDATVIAILGCTIGLDVASWSEAAETSVASHMMTACWISDDRRRLHVSNAAEPVLAAAAAGFLLQEVTLNEVLGELSKMCKEGVVTGGPRGEIVTRLLLLLAMLACRRDTGDATFTGEIKLGAFLSKLLGKVPHGLAGTVDLDAGLNFNGFSPTYRNLERGLINECLQHIRALTCKPGQEAVDNIVPSTGGPIGIQAKRWESNNSTKMRRAVGKLEAGVGGVNFMLGIILQLGSPEHRIVVEGAANRTIVVYGLSSELFPFLTQATADKLLDVLKVGSAEYLLHMTDGEQRIYGPRDGELALEFMEDAEPSDNEALGTAIRRLPSDGVAGDRLKVLELKPHGGLQDLCY
ncbi:hypothetical protein SELMODRAFT_428878 [Selaginella moellendorffii]|uniref:Uncharacterized protein n=1 Tax=Selaginella moellendorffii TaxID=88036 RepID=D8T4A6_SELML|nr:hypothetical protein SELMODRAFT_428878 [Selaginella moellendorffii]